VWPKPRLTYGQGHVEDLLEATPNAIIGGKRKLPVTAAPDKSAMKWAREPGGVGQGGMRGRRPKVGDGRGKGPRKCGYVNDTKDEEEVRVGKKGGCTYGAANWWEQDLTVMLDLVEELLPAGKKGLTEIGISRTLSHDGTLQSGD